MAFRLLVRWTVFNVVGALGVAVQLGALFVLLRWTEFHYLLSTAIAVEAAVLHNFVWHQRWTWRDRPASSAGVVVGRLFRFHLLNGAISLGGNLAVMAWLTGALGLDPLPANGAGILLCSVLNFLAGDTLVFRGSPRATGCTDSLRWHPAPARVASPPCPRRAARDAMLTRAIGGR